MCFPTAHDKGNVFAVRLVLAHGKGNKQANGGNIRCEKIFAVRRGRNARQICLLCANIKTQGKLFFYRAFFFLPCAVENTHGKVSIIVWYLSFQFMFFSFPLSRV
jgi:hypothetical protein